MARQRNVIPTDAREPNDEELRETVGALRAFLDRSIGRPIACHELEELYLPLFGRLADALRRVRPLVEYAKAANDDTTCALRTAIEAFDAVADDWGWTDLAQPAPARSEFAEKRREHFMQTFGRPMYVAAMTIQSRARKIGDYEWREKELAEKGQRLGFKPHPKMDLEHARARLHEAEKAWIKTPCFGTRSPSLTGRSDYDLHVAWSRLRQIMNPPTPEEVSAERERIAKRNAPADGKMSAERRAQLLTLTHVGREILKDEGAGQPPLAALREAPAPARKRRDSDNDERDAFMSKLKRDGKKLCEIVALVKPQWGEISQGGASKAIKSYRESFPD